MNVAGDFDLFADAFPTNLLPSVFALILEEWPNVPRPEGKPLENRITNRLVGHLEIVLKKKPMPFHLACRPKLADADSDSESGEVDIYARSYAQHPDAFFTFECKRLNVQFDSGFQTGVSDYVGDDGMRCFISRQYPATCDCGGMIGYVMDGNVQTAIGAINRALTKNHQPLALISPYELAQAQFTPGEDRVRETSHDRNENNFIIYHLFLAY